MACPATYPASAFSETGHGLAGYALRHSLGTSPAWHLVDCYVRRKESRAAPVKGKEQQASRCVALVVFELRRKLSDDVTRPGCSKKEAKHMTTNQVVCFDSMICVPLTGTAKTPDGKATLRCTYGDRAGARLTRNPHSLLLAQLHCRSLNEDSTQVIHFAPNTSNNYSPGRSPA